ncbi:transglutaminase-like domain-containing protein [Saccharibacillus sacchari]|uniref:transglutaminase-like domain-containing protein n=1 Tax=Saccharibacillus sacchari TaxID=456493 RepID=UPI0004B5690C|nr:transglutaminase-like domain-containing protein [Saccharibacillus sacchari]
MHAITLQSTLSPDAYLQPSDHVDFHDRGIQERIRTFDQTTELERIQAAYEFVRDEISHSMDIRSPEVTRRASEVLRQGHGICYAKSHLLAALLRGMGIPAGMCYQRLTWDDTVEGGHAIHALNTVYLREKDQWIRLDARGNKEGVNAQFFIGKEQLAYTTRPELGEVDYETNFHEPPPAIIEALENHSDCMQMCAAGLPTELKEHAQAE